MFTILFLIFEFVVSNVCANKPIVCGTLLKPFPEPDPTTTTTMSTTRTTTLTTTPTTTTATTLSTTTPSPDPCPEPPWNESIPVVINPPSDFESNGYSCTLTRLDVPLCSATIISKTFALSPCNRCFKSELRFYIPEDFQLQYGIFDEYSAFGMELVSHSVRRLIRHPECKINQHTPEYDIGIVQIEGRMKINPNDFAILPKSNMFSFDATRYIYLSNFRIYNVLATNKEESVWTVLTKAVDGAYCASMLGSYSYRNLCAGYQHVGGADFCKTDIGSGLSVRIKDEETLIGLLIDKRCCGRARSVAAFVSLKNHVQWIRQTVRKYSGGHEIV